MKTLRNNVIRIGLDALYYTGAHRLLSPLLSGVGTIFMLHHVRPGTNKPFQPNRHLEITPDFLRATLAHVQSLGIDIVTMDELHDRMTAGETANRSACFTFDDGYRDNFDFALPVMREHGAPMTVYVASDFAEGQGRLWWVALERVLAAADTIDIRMNGIDTCIDTAAPEAKQLAFQTIHDWLRTLPSDRDVQDNVSALCARYGIDDKAICSELCMSWDELSAFAQDPLVTLGAHTVSHCHLGSESEEVAEQEMRLSRQRLEAKLGRTVDHFAYPYGDRRAAASREFALASKIGFKTAVTTRPGMIFPESAAHLAALPRISLNGNYQSERFLSVLTSGAATAVWNGFRRVDAA